MAVFNRLSNTRVERFRFPVTIAMTGGDWDRFASNTAWTYFPFGRLAKGVSRSLENPAQIAEHLLGIPPH
jgi:hypothetical protein